MVRRRVPADEVDDVVQATLTEALASASAPDSLEDLRRWVWGIARHKVADLHRKHRRESPEELPEFEAPADDHESDDLLRWAERELPEGEGARQTLGWLLREGDGEKLEHIAASENLPAPRVRQRVTRLRQHFRSRWQTQLAAVATLIGATALLWWWLRPRPVPEAPIVREVPSAVPLDPTLERARELRRLALEACQARDFDRCLRGLDDAARLDPAGDRAPEVVAAREAARSVAPSPSDLAPSLKGPAPTTPRSTATSTPAPTPTTSTTPSKAKKPAKSSSTSELLSPVPTSLYDRDSSKK